MTAFTPREIDVMQGLWNGLSLKEIAWQRGLTMNTVRRVCADLRRRAGGVTTIAAIRQALQQGVLTV